MTTLPASASTHAETVMEMLSAAARFGIAGVSIDDMATRLYPDGRPTFYAASIRSSIQKVRKLLAEAGGGIVFDGERYALAIRLPGIFKHGVGFVRRGPARQARDLSSARFVSTACRRAGR